VFATPLWSSDHYIDNTASGNNDGTSWVHAWESFADINWPSINSGDTVYISGGNSSKTYFEALNPSASGSAGSPIIITKGEDPNHNGTVIIDGAGTRGAGVDHSQNYITLDGLNFEDHVGTGGTINIDNATGSVVRNCDITNENSRGIHYYNVSEGLIYNNNIETGAVDTSTQTDGIYLQNGDNNVVDGNVVVLNNTNSTPHADPLQAVGETDLIIRNNWLEIQNGNAESQGLIVSWTESSLKIYNNVILGSVGQEYQAALINQNNDASKAPIEFWNNTVIAQHPNGIACRFIHTPGSLIESVKNNICMGYYAAYFDNGIANSANVDNNCMSASHPSIVGYDGSSKTWNEWQAAGYDLNGINQNPGLDSSYSPDSPNDPVVDAGTTIADISTDIDGTSRPQGDAYDMGAYEYSGPAGYPTLTSSVVKGNGTQIELTFSETVSQGSAYSDNHWDLDCDTSDITLTYVSGDGTAIHTYTIGETIYRDESCDIDFDGTADSMEDGSGGDLQQIASDSVTVNSTYLLFMQGVQIN